MRHRCAFFLKKKQQHFFLFKYTWRNSYQVRLATDLSPVCFKSCAVQDWSDWFVTVSFSVIFQCSGRETFTSSGIRKARAYTFFFFFSGTVSNLSTNESISVAGLMKSSQMRNHSHEDTCETSLDVMIEMERELVFPALISHKDISFLFSFFFRLLSILIHFSFSVWNSCLFILCARDV